MLYSESKYKRIFMLTVSCRAADTTTKITLLQQTNCAIVRSLQTSFRIFSHLVVAGCRLHVSARDAHARAHAHALLYPLTHAPYKRELTY